MRKNAKVLLKNIPSVAKEFMEYAGAVTLPMFFMGYIFSMMFIIKQAIELRSGAPIIIGILVTLSTLEIIRHHPQLPLFLEILVGPFRFRKKYYGRAEVIGKIAYSGYQETTQLLYKAKGRWPYGGVWITGESALLVRITHTDTQYTQETYIRSSTKMLENIKTGDSVVITYQYARIGRTVLAKLVH
tara:strand:- start:323 stop:883 length:561 start_codon:yes stop_codon:yes gene_type:complete